MFIWWTLWIKCGITWGETDYCLSLFWCVWALTEMLCFCRWQLAQKQEWDGEHRQCLVPAASARAGSPPSGVWTLPQRKRQKPIPLSTRSMRFSVLVFQPTAMTIDFLIYPLQFCLNCDHSTYFLFLQVFADGDKPVKKSVDGIYVDPAKEHTVSKH